MRGDAYHAGPVMLSDVYTSAVGSAKDGVAASQRALYDAYNSLNSSIDKQFWKHTLVDNANDAPYGVSQIADGKANNPNSFWSVLLTLGNNNTAYKQQIALPYGNNQAGAAFRRMDNGAWSSWQYFLMRNEFATDVYSTGNMTVTTSTSGWSISATKSGYTVLMCSPLIYGYSAEVIMAPEGISFGNGSFSMSGFMRRYSGDPLTINIRVIVLWRKN